MKKEKNNNLRPSYGERLSSGSFIMNSELKKRNESEQNRLYYLLATILYKQIYIHTYIHSCIRIVSTPYSHTIVNNHFNLICIYLHTCPQTHMPLLTIDSLTIMKIEFLIVALLRKILKKSDGIKYC